VTDAYAVIKVLSNVHKIKKFRLIVNQVDNRKQALRIYRYLTNVADEYLEDVSIDYLGHVVSGPEVSQSVMQRQLFLDYAPESGVSDCVRQLVDDLHKQPAAEQATGNLQFFWRKLVRPEGNSVTDGQPSV
jgi:flagellar biosynthesis protein FlhG